MRLPVPITNPAVVVGERLWGGTRDTSLDALRPFMTGLSKRSRAFAWLVALAMVPISTLAGQNSANASITADVQQPLTVTKTADLAFGTVYPGLNKTVAVTDGGAAKFTVAGQASANINLTFTLPTTIASGGNTLPIASWSGRHNTSNSAASGTDFTPSASATSAAVPGGGTLYVFVGATVQPAAGQAAGSYSGSMTLTVVYF